MYDLTTHCRQNSGPGIEVVDIAGTAVSSTSAQLGVNVVQVNGQTASAAGTVTFPGTIASTTNITAGTITTATNVTNGVNATAINGSATAAANLAVSAATMLTGKAVTGTLSSTVFTTNLASTTTNAYVGRIVLFTSGALIDEAQTIKAYSNTGQITVASGFTTAPSNNDAFIIV
jgi:hypothetical protein